MSHLFAKKSLRQLLAEMHDDQRLKRVLGPSQLTALGVGAIIGTGIFILTGQAAHDKAGPALVLSFVVAGLACVFAALCYAEFASMAPVAGSAYTYAYATMGELFAWIIGWDLVLEYAVSASAVAHGWSAHFQELIRLFHLSVPHVISTAPFDYQPEMGTLVATGAWFDLPAIAITAIITVVLVWGISESASLNTAMVVFKVIIVLFVIVVGAFYVKVENWTSEFAPYGYDERQYCSPGFNLPVGCLMRTPYGQFPEYHTSADNLAFVQPQSLADSFAKCCQAFAIDRKSTRLNSSHT